MTTHVRILKRGDEGRLDNFLAPHTPFAFFMRSNSRKTGVTYQGEAYNADYFGAFRQGSLVGLLAHSWLGSVQIFAPEHALLPDLAQKWRQHLKKHPRETTCFLGPREQIEILLSALDLAPAAFRNGRGEDGLFALSLRQLVIPDLLKQTDVKTRRATSSDIEQLAAWRHDFNVEALGDPPGENTYNKSHAEITRRTEEGDLFLLEHNGQPVSFCGIGGFLPDWKCVGPVWTPPHKRNRGYAKAVTAGALHILRQSGLSNAVLFAQKEEAVRAYRGVGFTRIGDWRLDFLQQPRSSL